MMKLFRTFKLLAIFLYATATGFSYTVIVNDSGTLQAPDGETFKKANDIPSFAGVQILIDTSDAWTDAEFKVVDSNGNLIYWVSTQWGTQMGDEYETNAAADLNAKIFYTCPQYDAIPGNGRRWIEYVHNSTNARSIYEHAKTFLASKGIPHSSPDIGGIIIQPNFKGNTVGGTSIKSIFGSNAYNVPAGNQYIYLKCSPTSVEHTDNPKYNFWRPIIPKHILNLTNLQ